MPEPLAIPVMEARPELSGTLDNLGLVSVVRIASAKLRKWSGVALAVVIKSGSWELIFFAGNGTPMMPVEEGNTCDLRIFRWRAVSAHTDLQARTPAGPVAQFAFPEFTTTARVRPRLCNSALRPTSTGAATTRFFVNRAAAEVCGPASMSARSGLPLTLIPAVAAENANPLGRKIGPESLIPEASPASSPAQAEWRSAATRLSPSPLHHSGGSGGRRSNLC